MEIRQIKLNNQIIEYQLNIKKIKKCYLKIISGKVIVNSSPFFSINDIILKDVGEYKAVFHDNKIYVYHYEIQEVIETNLKKILYDYISKQIDYYLNNDFVCNTPIIEIKKLKSRWGACFLKQNKVSFNLVLVHLEKCLIDYVIIHELCHFIQPNHSKAFYQVIEYYMPDYKERIKLAG